MRKSHHHLALISCALLVTLFSVSIHDTTSEIAFYGGEGTVAEYLYARPVGGWPAPFVADNPGTSVILHLGLEDNFRLGSFVADVAFWYLTSAGLWMIIRCLRRKVAGPKRDQARQTYRLPTRLL